MLKTSVHEELIARVKDEVVEWRRHFHQNPELSFEEVNTAQFVYEQLESFGGFQLSRPTKTSVVARLVGSQPGKVIGLRADMDALPIQEETHLEFASKIPGVMHACGHDGHTAMLLGAAKIFSQIKDEIKGELVFIFQHAEELQPGGARELVKEGVVDEVDYIFGIHLFSTLPVGKIGLVVGPMTSNSDAFDLKITGKGGHSSQPENSIDPIVIAAQVITNLQQIVSRNIDSAERLVLSTTTLKAGTAKNIIPESVEIGGSVRSLTPEVREQAVSLMHRIIKGVTEAHGASYELDYQYGYSSVVNEESLVKVVEAVVREQLGDDFVAYGGPVMGGEDFAAYLDKAPGCFIGVGAGNPEQGFDFPHHHPRFGIDEASLEHGLRIWANLPQKVYELLGDE
ncbi:amidohydrolase [Pullulanibacillus sp. KACC 23026]|uniref:M20 metallopeptidase family protein n=1 Tax=Pullulanibacillus sp. KACC 23026 TaxID=3028315 RepID=UPI0023B015DD|nr:amidohydrolase [Pullulanibacillus sp. KACC 23026]WEG13659.1 amidohydrolase [Pullulanibacillus sp. KACC 23026]